MGSVVRGENRKRETIRVICKCVQMPCCIFPTRSAYERSDVSQEVEAFKVKVEQETEITVAAMQDAEEAFQCDPFSPGSTAQSE